MSYKKIGILILIVISTAVASLFVFDSKAKNVDKEVEEVVIEEPKDRVVEVEIVAGTVFTDLMTEAGIDYGVAMDIYESSLDMYDLASVRAGRVIELVYDKDTDEFKELRYKVDSEEELFVKKENIVVESESATASPQVVGSKWVAELKEIPYEIEVVFGSGVVDTSLYQAALDNGIDERAIIELADAFQWTIDFATEPRVGDTFSFMYEKRYLDREYIMPGRILAGKYVNQNVPFYLFYFDKDEENSGFFDEEGNSAKKVLLKSPVSFKYISSGFTTGLRCLESFGLCTNHRAIDYAASCGTPIRSVGNGTVTFAGWSSVGYGNLTKIRHNGTYSTNYAHQSKIAVRAGQKVKQGEIIGYVGTTGLSTGCHLHYEVVQNGVKINPLTLQLPPGKPIKEELKEEYFAFIEDLKSQLDN